MIFEILTGAWPLAVTLAVFSSNIFRLGKVKRTLATSLTEVVAATYFALGWTWKNCLELTWLTLLKHYLIDACFFFRILWKFTFCTQHSDTPGLPCLLPLQLPWSLSKAKNIFWEHLRLHIKLILIFGSFWSRKMFSYVIHPICNLPCTSPAPCIYAASPHMDIDHKSLWSA